MSQRSSMTEEDRAAARQFRSLWDAYKRTHRVNQAAFAEQKLGWTQGNFSQYLTGGVPIGTAALKKLAAAFDCDPIEIRPELAKKP